MVGEERSLLQSGVLAVYGYFAGERSKTLTLFWNVVGKLALRKLFGIVPKRKDKRYV